MKAEELNNCRVSTGAHMMMMMMMAIEVYDEHVRRKTNSIKLSVFQKDTAKTSRLPYFHNIVTNAANLNDHH